MPIVETQLERQLENCMDAIFDNAADEIATVYYDNFGKKRLNKKEIDAILSRIKMRLININVVW